MSREGWATFIGVGFSVALTVTPGLQQWWLAIPAWLLTAWAAWRWYSHDDSSNDKNIDSSYSVASGPGSINDIGPIATKATSDPVIERLHSDIAMARANGFASNSREQAVFVDVEFPYLDFVNRRRHPIKNLRVFLIRVYERQHTHAQQDWQIDPIELTDSNTRTELICDDEEHLEFFEYSEDMSSIRFAGVEVHDGGQWDLTCLCYWDGQQQPAIISETFYWLPGDRPYAETQ